MMFWPCWIAPADYLSVLAIQGNSMSTKVHVKFCGLRSAADIAAAVVADARYVGFVFFPKSPRNVSFEEATALALEVPDGICKVALTVNADDAFLDALLDAVPIDMLQLHGTETPARVREVKARYGLPVMKAVGVADADDLAQLDLYMPVADQILVDAKPPKGADLPGGNGLAFDWRLIAGRKWPKPWMLAGGLTSENVAEAVQMTGARQVDVSSGVESAPGIKDTGLIAGFGQAAQKPEKV
jgi:phosphoribosylanthranilate isomerase